MNQIYVQTVNLLLDVVPAVFKAPCFAMKGGTAIDLFVQDMPRSAILLGHGEWRRLLWMRD